MRNRLGLAKTWRDLDVWRKAHELVLEVYGSGSAFPGEERFRLVDQLRRSAISVAANIVEGYARQTTKEFLQFLHHARGSIEETRYHLLLARDLGYLNPEQYADLEARCEQISKMLNALIQSLKEKAASCRSR